MNVPLFRLIQQAIVVSPEALRMDVWSCGTAHCIGGWACHLSGVKLKTGGAGFGLLLGSATLEGEPTASAAARLLDIEDGDELFSVDAWPKDLIIRWEAAETAAERATVAVAAIDRFIDSERRLGRR